MRASYTAELRDGGGGPLHVQAYYLMHIETASRGEDVALSRLIDRPLGGSWVLSGHDLSNQVRAACQPLTSSWRSYAVSCKQSALPDTLSFMLVHHLAFTTKEITAKVQLFDRRQVTSDF